MNVYIHFHYVSIHMHVLSQMFTYICTYMYIHTHMYVYIHKHFNVKVFLALVRLIGCPFTRMNITLTHLSDTR